MGCDAHLKHFRGTQMEVVANVGQQMEKMEYLT